jgi:CDP-diacylglycerol--serine O-phosphatidyltransferase
MYRAILPSLFTVGNLFCGFLALHYVILGNYRPAAWLIVLGAVLDKMDGKLARAFGKDSQFGIQFDSLTDVCTFGIVPAVMIYNKHLHSGWGLAITFLFVLCGALRLARFNSMNLNDEKGDFYLGLPIPAAAVCLTQYVLFTDRAWESAHAAALAVPMVFFLCFLMISRLDYDSMPNFRGTAFADRFKQAFFILSIGFVIHPATQDFFFLTVMGFTLSGVYRWAVNVFRDEVTQHA